MTPEAQRIAIAEACGWERVKRIPEIWKSSNTKYILPPDYLRDLNAMHEAERHIGSINALSQYADELDKICVPTHICPLTHWQAVVMATAAQRAEAFLRTIGRWSE